MTDQFLVYALSAACIYAVMMTIEVYGLRAKMRFMRSIYCEKCQKQIPAVCPHCTPLAPCPTDLPYRHGDRQIDPPPIQKPGPGRSRLG